MKDNTSRKIIKMISLGLVLLLMILMLDLVFTYYEPFSVGWSFYDYLNYSGRSILINLISLIVFIIIYFLLFYGISKLVKSDIFRNETLYKSFSFAFISLIIILILFPVNYYILPYLFHIKSIIVNVLLFISIVPLSILFYFTLFRWFEFSFLESKIFSSIVVILSILIIASSFFVEEKGGVNLEREDDVNPDCKYNIMIITIDTLRADHLSCYGYNKIETNNIDSVAEDGIIFSNPAPTVSWTTPSMMSMLTGKYPTVHGCIDVVHRSPESIVSIPQILQLYDYQTYGVVTTSMLNHKFGFARGFNKYIEYGDIDWLNNFSETRLYVLMQMIQQTIFEVIGISKDSTSWATDELSNYFENECNKPFFLWVHYLDPHSPYTPPDEYISDIYEPKEDSSKFKRLEYFNRNEYIEENKDSMLNLYDAEILYVDDKLGEIFNLMKENGVYDDTLIIISADHGEEFWEHNRWGHGYTFYPEVMRVPLIMKFPDSFELARDIRRIEEPVSLIYLPETILDLCGIDGYEHFEDKSILDFLREVHSDEDTIFAETYRAYPHSKMVSNSRFSLIYDAETGMIELYDIVEDPQELNDISEQRPEVVDELMDVLFDWMREVEVEKDYYGGADIVGMDAQTKEEMRGLGYIE